MSHMRDSVGESQWNDIPIATFALGTAAAAPALIDFTPITNMRLYGFSGSNPTPDELFGVAEILHGYKEGSDIRPHIHWAPASANGGTVKWQMSYSIASPNAQFPAGQLLSAVDSALGLNTHHAVEFSSVIPGANLKIGAQICFRLFRDPTDPDDNYPDPALLLSVGFHYDQDTLGSADVFNKERAE